MRFRAVPAFVVLAASTGACHSWRAQTAPAPEVIAAQNGRGTVRITRRDLSVLLLDGPQVLGDSIVGLAGNPPQHAAVALADIQRIDTRSVNAAKTGGLAVGTFLLAGVVLVGALTIAVLTSWN